MIINVSKLPKGFEPLLITGQPDGLGSTTYTAVPLPIDYEFTLDTYNQYLGVRKSTDSQWAEKPYLQYSQRDPYGGFKTVKYELTAPYQNDYVGGEGLDKYNTYMGRMSSSDIVSPWGNGTLYAKSKSVEPPPFTPCEGNLIPYPYKDTTKTENGITFTDNGNRSVSVSGIAESLTIFTLWGTPNLSKGKYKMSGCPDGGSSSTYAIQFNNVGIDSGKGKEFIVDDSTQQFNVVLVIRKGYKANNLVFSPCLIKLSEPEKIPIEVGTNLTDLTLTKSVDPLYYGDVVTYTLTPTENHYCEILPCLKYPDRLGATIEVPFNYNESENNYTLTFDTNVLVPGDLPLSILIYGIALAVNRSEFVQLYHVTDENLSLLAKSRFETMATGEGIFIIDHGEQITKVKLFFFGIGGKIKQNIILGNYDTKVRGEIIDTPILRLSLGKLSIEPPQNEYDYSVNKYYIDVPFCERVNIEPDYIFNAELSIDYAINMFDGTTSAVIWSKNNKSTVQVAMTHGSIAVDVPYIADFSRSPLMELDRYILSNRKTQLVRMKYKALNNGETFTDNATLTLSTLTGFVQGDIISFNAQITDEEREELETLFNEGVYNKV